MTSKKIFGALGLATVLGVAGVAAGVANVAMAVDVTYQATIDNSLAISSTSDLVSTGVTNGGSGTGSHTLTYSSNAAKGYVITATAETNTNLESSTSSIPYMGTLTSGTSGWNLTADSTVLNFGNGTTATVKSAPDETAASATIDVTFTVYASADQAAGTYSRKVTYTIAEYDA